MDSSLYRPKCPPLAATRTFKSLTAACIISMISSVLSGTCDWLLVTSPKGHTGPTVVVADVGTVSKREDGNSINSV